MKKQTTALLIAAGMVLSAGSMAQAATTDKVILSNHTETHFAAAASQHLVTMNLVDQDTVTSLNAEIDRKEMKDLLQKVVGKQVVDNNPSTNHVSRVEVAQWIASSIPAMNTGIAGDKVPYPYLDTQAVSTEQHNSLHELYKLGIMVGDGQGHFAPNQTLTRGEAAVLLDKVLGRTMSVAKKVSFEKFGGQLPETVNTVMDENKYAAGVYSVEDGGFLYVIVAGGEQPNGGYSVNVNNVSETDAGIFVDASIQGPEPGVMYTQMISYPVQVLKLQPSKKPVYKAGNIQLVEGQKAAGELK